MPVCRRACRTLGRSMSLISHSDPVEAGPPWQHAAVCAAAWICTGSVVAWILLRVWPALLLPWWYNTDEVVIYYEVIRQLRLNPGQTFFDIPATPFMTLTTILTALWWAVEKMVGLAGSATPSDFAFAHVQGVFTLMRSLTLGLYVVAVALALDLFRRAAGVLTAVLTVLLLATLPVHVNYSYFVRTESFGLVLCLGAIWMVLYSRWRGTAEIYGCAGLLAGVAMGARYHFALVGLPALLAIYFLRDRDKLPPGPYVSTHRVLYAAASALAALFLAGGVVTVLFKANLVGTGWLTNIMLLTTPAGPSQYPGAKLAVAKLWILAGGGALSLLLFYRFGRRCRHLWAVVNPVTLLLSVGFVAGFVLSHPSFLWRGEYQLRSIQFYSDWIDPNLARLGPLGSWWHVTTYYFNTALPGRGLPVAFFTGAAIILWRRHPVHVAFLIGAIICFFAHPVTMKLWPHHIIPWLPFLCFVAAVPAGFLAAWFARRLARYQRPELAAAVVLLLAMAMIVECRVRLRSVDEYLKISRARTVQIWDMNRWVSEHVPANAYLLVSYFALNEDGFLKWIENSGVPVPPFVKKHNNVQIWWLDRGAVDGHAGYVCMSRADIAFFRDDFERRNPGSTYNPFENPAFRPLASFGGGFYELQVFQFDFRRPSGS